MDKIYLCIDLKTFFASVECVERNLDPFKTDLVVADPSRGNGAICLAISPHMKARGIRNRCRVFEIPKHVKYITAVPRMKKYIEYSAKVYSVYLKYISEDDIHVYSIDEAFLDVTSYLKLYKQDAFELARTITNDILKSTGLTASVGIGTNLYLTKIALDITAKHSEDHMGYLDEEKYKQELWHHLPLRDFWQIGAGIEARLNKLRLKDMYDVAHCDEKILYKEFGINARYIIDHSKGIETCTIKEIKAYKPKSKSLSNSQILFKDYNFIAARKVLVEMVDNLVLQLASKKMYTKVVGFMIGYSKDVIPPLKVSRKLEQQSNSFSKILQMVLEEYDYRINESTPIRKLGIWFNEIGPKKYEQLDLFSSSEIEEEDNKLEDTVNNIKNKYGKNSILRGISYDEEATGRQRNKLIGGHNAE